MRTETKLDNRLVRAIREGADALPEDLTLLCRYLRLIDGLLAEKAAELEPSWTQACASAAEIETLQALETAVTERAIAVRAREPSEILAKLAMWRELASGDPDADLGTPRSRLVLSIEADLERFCRPLRR